MISKPSALPAISDAIWRRKYRFAGSASVPADQTLEDTFRRVAEAAASVEKGGKRKRQSWANTFYDALSDFGFQPAGRILAGAGTDRNVTLFNCFVLGRDRRRSLEHFRKRQRSGADDAGGRRHRSRFFDASAQGRARQKHRSGRIGARELHGRLGCDVPDDHVGRSAARRHDGDAQMRPPGYRNVHRGEGGRACGSGISTCRFW